MKNIFVGNLSFQTSESELRAAFEEYGAVDQVRIMTDHETGRSRGFGFVEMADDDAAETAIAKSNGKELAGRRLNVSAAMPRAARHPGGSDGYRRDSGLKRYA